MNSSWPQEFILLAMLRQGPDHGDRSMPRTGAASVVLGIRDAQTAAARVYLGRLQGSRALRAHGIHGKPDRKF